MSVIYSPDWKLSYCVWFLYWFIPTQGNSSLWVLLDFKQTLPALKENNPQHLRLIRNYVQTKSALCSTPKLLLVEKEDVRR